MTDLPVLAKDTAQIATRKKDGSGTVPAADRRLFPRVERTARNAETIPDSAISESFPLTRDISSAGTLIAFSGMPGEGIRHVILLSRDRPMQSGRLQSAALARSTKTTDGTHKIF